MPVRKTSVSISRAVASGVTASIACRVGFNRILRTFQLHFAIVNDGVSDSRVAVATQPDAAGIDHHLAVHLRCVR